MTEINEPATEAANAAIRNGRALHAIAKAADAADLALTAGGDAARILRGLIYAIDEAISDAR